MAGINYYYRSQKDTGNLTVQFSYKRNVNIRCATPIHLPKKAWDKKRQRVKNIGAMKNAGVINEKLISLQAAILSGFNIAMIEGEEINSKWLKKTILTYFNRPLHEVNSEENLKHKLFFVDFCDFWITEKLESGKWKNPKTKKPLSSSVVGHYKSSLNFIKDYQEVSKEKFKIRDINLDFCQGFCEFMETKNYGANYINRIVTRIKYFCARAEEENLEVNKVYKSQNFSAPTEDTADPYLNPDEIQDIINLDIKEEWLNNIRDWFVIGLHTGLRVSDLLGDEKRDCLSIDNIEGDYIHIKTKKTNEVIAVPLHNNVIEVLRKRNGNFPEKISHKHFNEHIKTIAKDAGITQMIKTSIKDDSNRKVKGDYEKWRAVSSHICRRSFATNHYGKTPTSVIMKIGGWRTESAFLRYIKKTNLENAQELKKYWDEQVN